MYSNVLFKTLRDGRRSMLLYALAQFLFEIYLSLLFPDVASGFAQMVDDLPEFLQSFIGSAEEFATPEGFFSTDPYGVITPIVMIALAVNRGVGAVAGEEQAHTLDQLLGNPISRTKLYIHKSLALIVDCLLPTIAVAAAILLGAIIMDYSLSTTASCRCRSACCSFRTRWDSWRSASAALPATKTSPSQCLPSS